MKKQKPQNKKICIKCREREATHVHYKLFKDKPLPKKTDHQLLAKKHPRWFEDLCAICHGEIHGISPKKSELKYLVTLRDRKIKIRNVVNNQIKGFGDIEIKVPETFQALKESLDKEIKVYEKKIKEDIEQRKYSIWSWLEKIKGISYVTAAKLIALIDIKKSPSITALWSYCGLNSKYVRRSRGITLETAKKYGSPYLKKELLGVLARVFIMQNEKYKGIYDAEKVRQQEKVFSEGELKKIYSWYKKTDTNLSKGHCDKRAKRKMVKEFIKELWLTWRKVEKLPISKSFQEKLKQDKPYAGYTNSERILRIPALVS